MRAAPALALLLAACGSASRAPHADTAGAQLESAAISTGIVDDPAHASLVGSWALETDRVCVLPLPGDRLRIGALVDYGQGQGCAASGSARREGDHVHVAFDTCRFDATFDGHRIVFPADLPATCDRLCSGRASLAALTVERLSTSTAEAETLRAPGGKLLCASAAGS